MSESLTTEQKLAIALEALEDIEWSDECASNVAAEAIKKINGSVSKLEVIEWKTWDTKPKCNVQCMGNEMVSILVLQGNSVNQALYIGDKVELFGVTVDTDCFSHWAYVPKGVEYN